MSQYELYDGRVGLLQYGDAKRYEWILVGNVRVCQCPLCCFSNDYQRIGRLAPARNRKARQPTNEVPPEQEVSQFIGQAITAGYQAVADTNTMHAGEGMCRTFPMMSSSEMIPSTLLRREILLDRVVIN